MKQKIVLTLLMITMITGILTWYNSDNISEDEMTETITVVDTPIVSASETAEVDELSESAETEGTETEEETTEENKELDSNCSVDEDEITDEDSPSLSAANTPSGLINGVSQKSYYTIEPEDDGVEYTEYGDTWEYLEGLDLSQEVTGNTYTVYSDQAKSEIVGVSVGTCQAIKQDLNTGWVYVKFLNAEYGWILPYGNENNV